jgi:hypothetical protein
MSIHGFLGYRVRILPDSSPTMLLFLIAINYWVSLIAFAHMLGIQTENCSDSGGGLNVGWIDTNDWLSYASVNIPKSGYYEIRFRVASALNGGILQFERSGGAPIYGSTSIPNTGGWQNWQTASQVVYLEAGVQGFGVKALSGGFNFNWFSITPRN